VRAHVALLIFYIRACVVTCFAPRMAASCHGGHIQRACTCIRSTSESQDRTVVQARALRSSAPPSCSGYRWRSALCVCWMSIGTRIACATTPGHSSLSLHRSLQWHILGANFAQLTSADSDEFQAIRALISFSSAFVSCGAICSQAAQHSHKQLNGWVVPVHCTSVDLAVALHT
jgi:hypothetical protein